jgi:hypothetical protein
MFFTVTPGGVYVLARTLRPHDPPSSAFCRRVGAGHAGPDRPIARSPPGRKPTGIELRSLEMKNHMAIPAVMSTFLRGMT